MNTLALTDIRVSGGVTAPAQVRAALAREFGGRLVEQQLGELRLLASEVVTNSVVHGGVGDDGWVCASVSMTNGRIRVEVRDSGIQGEPAPREAGSLEAGGYGLRLVDIVAADWGIARDPGLCVWFELELA